jgi:predicted nucleic acid-binding protein
VNRVTLDSNVYLSGFVFGGKPKRVLEMAIDGEIEVAVSDPIIQEVRRHLLVLSSYTAVVRMRVRFRTAHWKCR